MATSQAISSAIALADGAVVEDLEVIAGTITLDQAASTVHIGLRYVAELTTLPIVYEAEALGVTSLENINAVQLRVRNTGPLLEAGPDFVDMREMLDRFDLDIGSVPGLRSETVHITIDEDWVDEASVSIRQRNPLPVTILALAPEFAETG